MDNIKYLLVILLIALVSGAFYLLVNKVQTLSSDLASANKDLKTLSNNITVLKEQMQTDRENFSKFQKASNTSQTNADERVGKLEKSLTRQEVIAKKPGLVTIIAKKQVNEFERNLACLTGNLTYCARLQSQQQGAAQPKSKSNQ